MKLKVKNGVNDGLMGLFRMGIVIKTFGIIILSYFVDEKTVNAYIWSRPFQGNRGSSGYHIFQSSKCVPLKPILINKKRAGGCTFDNGLHLYSMQDDEDDKDMNQNKGNFQDFLMKKEGVFDDFQGITIGEDVENMLSSKNSPQNEVMNDAISSLLTTVTEKKLEQGQRTLRNWNRGNWIVRGFALDKNPIDTREFSVEQQDYNSDNEIAMPIHVCKLAMDESSHCGEDLVAVGRSDGSVYVVRLGSDFLTTFKAIPNVSFESYDFDNDSDYNSAPCAPEDRSSGMESRNSASIVKINTKMVRSDTGNESESSQVLDSPLDKNPFEIDSQFCHTEDSSSSAFNSPISALLFVDESSVIYTSTEGFSEIKEWILSDDTDINADDGSNTLSSSKTFDKNVHSDTIVSLKSIDCFQTKKKYLLSASLDGSFALWDRQNGELIKQIHIQDTLDNEGEKLSDISILCADVELGNNEEEESTALYFGLSTGHVVGYQLVEILSNDTPRPSSFFLFDSSSVSVTAIKCGGTRSNSLSSISTTLVCGGENGEVKQWEMIRRKMPQSTSETIGQNMLYQKIERWPRLPTQRLRNRAHVFKKGYRDRVSSIQILNLDDNSPDDGDNVNEQSQLILIGSIDGSIQVISAQSGEILYRMDGFTSKLSSLCLCGDQNILITDGMDHVVCLHDFDAEEDIKFDLSW